MGKCGCATDPPGATRSGVGLYPGAVSLADPKVPAASQLSSQAAEARLVATLDSLGEYLPYRPWWVEALAPEIGRVRAAPVPGGFCGITVLDSLPYDPFVENWEDSYAALAFVARADGGGGRPPRRELVSLRAPPEPHHGVGGHHGAGGHHGGGRREGATIRARWDARGAPDTVVGSLPLRRDVTLRCVDLKAALRRYAHRDGGLVASLANGVFPASAGTFDATDPRDNRPLVDIVCDYVRGLFDLWNRARPANEDEALAFRPVFPFDDGGSDRRRLIQDWPSRAAVPDRVETVSLPSGARRVPARDGRWWRSGNLYVLQRDGDAVYGGGPKDADAIGLAMELIRRSWPSFGAWQARAVETGVVAEPLDWVYETPPTGSVLDGLDRFIGRPGQPADRAIHVIPSLVEPEGDAEARASATGQVVVVQRNRGSVLRDAADAVSRLRAWAFRLWDRVARGLQTPSAVSSAIDEEIPSLLVLLAGGPGSIFDTLGRLVSVLVHEILHLVTDVEFQRSSGDEPCRNPLLGRASVRRWRFPAEFTATASTRTDRATPHGMVYLFGLWFEGLLAQSDPRSVPGWGTSDDDLVARTRLIQAAYAPWLPLEATGRNHCCSCSPSPDLVPTESGYVGWGLDAGNPSGCLGLCVGGGEPA